MMKIAFTGYTHISKESCIENVLTACDKQNIQLSEEAEIQASYWGYEISFQCELDTRTGDVDIIGCNDYLIDKSKKLENKDV